MSTLDYSTPAPGCPPLAAGRWRGRTGAAFGRLRSDFRPARRDADAKRWHLIINNDTRRATLAPAGESWTERADRRTGPLSIFALRRPVCRSGTDFIPTTAPASFCLLPSAFRIPHSALRIPHSAFRIPHSALRIPHSALGMLGLLDKGQLLRDHVRAKECYPLARREEQEAISCQKMELICLEDSSLSEERWLQRR